MDKYTHEHKGSQFDMSLYWDSLKKSSQVIQAFGPLSDDIQRDVKQFLSDREAETLKKWTQFKPSCMTESIHKLSFDEQLALLSAADKLAIHDLIPQVTPYVASHISGKIEGYVHDKTKAPYKKISSYCMHNAVVKQLIAQRLLQDDIELLKKLFASVCVNMQMIAYDSSKIISYDVSEYGGIAAIVFGTNVIEFIRLKDGSRQRIRLDASVDTIALSNDGEYCIAFSSSTGTLYGIDIIVSDSFISLKTSFHAIKLAALSNAGYVALVSRANELIIINLRTGEKLFDAKYPSITHICWSSDGYKAAVGTAFGEVHEISLSEQQAKCIYKHAAPVTSLSFVDEGHSIQSTSNEGAIASYSLNTHEMKACSLFNYKPRDITHSNRLCVAKRDCRNLLFIYDCERSFLCGEIGCHDKSVDDLGKLQSKGYHVFTHLKNYSALAHVDIQPFEMIQNAFASLSMEQYIVIKKMLYAQESHRVLKKYERRLFESLDSELQQCIKNVKQ